MDLRQLRYFLCIAEKKNFSAAAQKLHMSQPPLSRSIMVLEEEIGAPLFIREKNGLVLTDAGKLLQLKGIELINLHEYIMAELRSITFSGKNKIVIGSNDASNALIVPQFIKLFHENFHNAEINSYSGTANEITNRILSGEIDIGFLRWPLSGMEFFDMHKLHEGRWVAALSASHQLLKEGLNGISLEILSSYPLIMPSRESLYLPIVKAFTEKALTPDIQCYYFELENGVILAKQGVGIAIIPNCTQRMFRDNDYKIMEITDLNETTFFSAIKRKDANLSPVVNKSWEIIKKHNFRI
ncbi:LysR family transcriptional regulator [Cloacibacillus sp.]|uniref:LysR family transcriptional regulator n=1 Tax=Cloacibacillus sp. TaxID=2049023 RepID=UPI0025B8CCB9|nr:LysR family transcriptional regulator [Cloacibacillus sp.]MCC8057254.1 LysR family transcriptional regulator [Cloacibacillus sp.]